MKRFVIGDIHGTHKALKQCLERSGFNQNNDLLIVLGDIVDRYPDVKKCVEELLSIKSLILVLGNHDCWFMDWMNNPNKIMPDWDCNGGLQTKKSYGEKAVPESHKIFFEKGKHYYIQDNKLFVHAGWNEKRPDKDQDNYFLMWDRSFWESAKRQQIDDPNHTFTKYDEVFIGHTPTRTKEPLRCCNVWNIDQGAGWNGYLTIMNIDTHEWWKSDCVSDLYKQKL